MAWLIPVEKPAVLFFCQRRTLKICQCKTLSATPHQPLSFCQKLLVLCRQNGQKNKMEAKCQTKRTSGCAE